MGLKIGQVAQLTDMSVETIRFYEKEQILSPKRNKESTYRIYDAWDVFTINEAKQYRNMGFSLRDVKQMMQEDDLEELDRKITDRYRSIEKQIEYQHMLVRSLVNLHDRICTARYNIDNYWIRKDDAFYYYPYCSRVEDEYSEVDYRDKELKHWLNTAPFYKTHLHTRTENITADANEDIWCISLEEDYFDFLGLSKTDQVGYVPARTCLHTIIDMGEKGNLQIGMLAPVLDYIKHKGYQIGNDVVGEILIKCHEDNLWHRYMEIKIPLLF